MRPTLTAQREVFSPWQTLVASRCELNRRALHRKASECIAVNPARILLAWITRLSSLLEQSQGIGPAFADRLMSIGGAVHCYLGRYQLLFRRRCQNIYQWITDVDVPSELACLVETMGSSAPPTSVSTRMRIAAALVTYHSYA